MNRPSGAPLAHSIVQRLRTSGYQAWLVGGCVRDLLLGIEPKDFDVATDATPDRVLALYPQAQQVGAHFGVVVISEDHAQVEVATFRSDYSYEDGRHPSLVKFETDPRQDALRRDFTINALFMDPASGDVLDFAGGREDLAHGVIRAIGEPEARFQEDHLRMLRAIRFAARFGFSIHPETMAAMREQRAHILRVAGERVRDEIVYILTEGGARRGFELLDESGLLEQVLPEVAATKGVEQPPQFHPEGDVWTHTLLLLENMRGPSVTLALGALLHDIGKPPTFRIADRIRFDGHAEIGAEIAVGILGRLRFSHDETRQVELLVRNHLRFKDAPQMKDSTLKRFMRLPAFEEHLELHRLDCISSHRLLGNYELVKAKLEQFSIEEIRPRPLITGRDLIAAGYRPGPVFSEMLTAAEDAQLDGQIATPAEAMVMVRERFGAPEGLPGCIGDHKENEQGNNEQDG